MEQIAESNQRTTHRHHRSSSRQIRPPIDRPPNVIRALNGFWHADAVPPKENALLTSFRRKGFASGGFVNLAGARRYAQRFRHLGLAVVQIVAQDNSRSLPGGQPRNRLSASPAVVWSLKSWKLAFGTPGASGTNRSWSWIRMGPTS